MFDVTLKLKVIVYISTHYYIYISYEKVQIDQHSYSKNNLSLDVALTLKFVQPKSSW